MLNNIIVLNIREYLSGPNNAVLRENALQNILSEFSCQKNPDVEKFLKEQAINFTKKNQSVTYLVFAEQDTSLLGYFTLAIKPITINAEYFSNTIKRKLARVGRLNETTHTYILSAYLIAQLGKNFTNDINKQITGNQLLQAAIDTVKELQYMAGGMAVFLEAEDNNKLMHFYETQNNFKRFNTKETNAGTDEPHSLIQLLKIL